MEITILWKDAPMTKEQITLESIRHKMEALPGHLGFYYKNLVTGYEYGIRENEAFLAASVIKFPIFLYPAATPGSRVQQLQSDSWVCLSTPLLISKDRVSVR